jgi:hypothetical protein
MQMPYWNGTLKGGTNVTGMKKLRKFQGELRMMRLEDMLKMLSEYFYSAEIFATLPITTNTSDRSVSTLRRIKMYLRKTTG